MLLPVKKEVWMLAAIHNSFLGMMGFVVLVAIWIVMVVVLLKAGTKLFKKPAEKHESNDEDHS